MWSVSKLRKLSRPPGSVECASREKYTSFASEPPIYNKRRDVVSDRVDV
jgi:hypothetical protein